MKKLLSYFFILGISFTLISQNLAPVPADVISDYTRTTIILSAVNANVTAFNIVGLLRSKPNNTLAIVGLTTGFAQSAFAFVDFAEYEEPSQGVRAVNLGVGIAAILSSGFVLFSKRSDSDDKLYRFNISYIRTEDARNTVPAFVFKARF